MSRLSRWLPFAAQSVEEEERFLACTFIYGHQTRYHSRNVNCSCCLRRKSRIWGGSIGGCRFQPVSLDCRIVRVSDLILCRRHLGKG
jgi:hypothetical protein